MVIFINSTSSFKYLEAYAVRIYGEPYTHKFCAVDNFLNITRHQAISPVGTFHHVLGRGFMIPRAIFYKY